MFSTHGTCQKGVTLIELMISVVVMTISALAFLTMFDNQLRGGNFVEFKISTSNLRAAASSQFFSDSQQCRCLFNRVPTNIPSVTDPAPITLALPAGFEFGNYTDPSDPNCATTSLISPMIRLGGTPINFIDLNSITIDPIRSSNPLIYNANLSFNIRSVKPVAGPRDILATVNNLQFEVDAGGDIQRCGFNLIPPTPPNFPLSECEVVSEPNVSPHVVDCGTDKAMTSIKTFANNRLTGPLQITCCTLGTNVYSAAPIIVGPGPTTNADDQEHFLECPNDFFMTGISITGSQLDGNMSLRCAQFPGLALTERQFGTMTNSGITQSNQDEQPHEFSCPDNQILNAIGFWASSRFDNISRVKCSEQN